MSHHRELHPFKDAGVVADSHPQCDGKVTLDCQLEPHTQGYLGDHTGKNPEDSTLASVEVMQWVLCYLSVGHLAQHG
jgi:hypothetical protein